MRRLTRLAAALAAAGLITAFAAPARAELLISVDKSTQTMTVAEDGATLYTWPVSTGVARYDTPSGEWKPFRMEKDHFSREWDDAPMPYSIFFTMKGHAIHGTNHKIDGAPHSHGCVRLSVAHAATLWALVKKNKMANTRVVLTGTVEDAAPAVARRRAPAPAAAGNGEFGRTYSTDDLDGRAGVVEPPPQPRQRVIGGWRETTDGDTYVYERPRGLFQAPPRYRERRYYVVPGDGYEVPPPRYYYYSR
ncbi:MAG: L,D-transpeptidase [Proteobacteria bacterium]|nr:L,D-transpeptidase [Pseudomonadota bacterium]